ncbi:MAG: hypothetical protein ACI80V_001887 [Rhodothermales bacterium]|jgi:hypothetical protein
MTANDKTRGIRSRLRAARTRLALGELGAGVLVILAITVTIWLLAAGLESLFRLPSAARIGLAVVATVIVSAILIRYAIIPVARWLGWIQGLSDDAVARRVGTAFPDVRDRLLNMLQLLDGRHSESPGPIVAEAARRLGQTLAAVPVERVEDFAAAKRAGRLASLPIVGLLAFALLGGNQLREATGRLLSPASTFEPAPTYSLSVLPGNATLIKGADVHIAATLTGTGFPEEAFLEYRYEDEDASELVAMSPIPESSYELVNVRKSMAYRVIAGRVSSEWFSLTITDRPIVTQISSSLRYPSYTQLPAVALPDNDGSVTALLGTRVVVNAIVTGPEVAEGTIVFGSGRREELQGSGRSWNGGFSVRRDDTWRVEVVSIDGVINADPIEYRIRATQDGAPSISFLAPEPSVDLDEAATVDVAWRMSDDYGFSALSLYFKLDESRFGEPSDSFLVLPLPVTDSYQLEQTGAMAWSLAGDTGLDPVPGDVFIYFLEVSDNNRVSGSSTARTPLYRLRMPSLAERFEALDQSEDKTEDSLEELVEEAQRVREQFDELREELRSKTESEWQDERALEQLMEKQEALEESAEKIADQMEALTEEMSQNDLVSEETLEMFEELREVAEEINSPELMEALKDLQESMEQMNMQEMQEAMENFEFSETQYQERMERTLELFKNLRVQQDLDEAAKRAEELAKTEAKLAEETEALESAGDMPAEEKEKRAEELAKEQERAAEEMEQLEDKLDEISERMEELKQAPDERMDEVADDTRREDMPAKMEENAEKMKSGEFQQAKQEQQQMSKKLESLQQDLQEMQQGMQGAQMEMNTAGLRRALDDVLGLSQDEENLRAEVQGLATDSPRLRDTAQQQLRLSEGLATVTDSLQSLARSIPQMSRDVQVHAGEAIREMSDATQSMTDRSARRASGHQKGAMTHLNELALMLADLLDQMMSGSGSGGNMSMEQMMEQLQNMSGQQQMLNQQVQQLLNDMQGNRLSQDVQERLRQLGGQQEKIRQDLRKLSRERSARSNALGDLEKIADQMQETIEEMQEHRVSSRTVQRQQEILTRMLEASKSMQERGREKRRESQSADQLLREGPSELSPNERADQLRRDLIRALERGYAPDYEDLIRRYFELLGQNASGEARTP